MDDLVMALDRCMMENSNVSRKMEDELNLSGFFAGGCYHLSPLGDLTQEECDAMLYTLRSLRKQRDATRQLMSDLTDTHFAPYVFPSK